jgi:hypothetical protein
MEKIADGPFFINECIVLDAVALVLIIPKHSPHKKTRISLLTVKTITIIYAYCCLVMFIRRTVTAYDGALLSPNQIFSFHTTE